MSINNLGSIIRQERIKQGLTQEQLAEKADISLNFMSLIENGKNMSVQTLINISRALSINLDSLINYDTKNERDFISEQIIYNLATLSDEEKLFILNVIKEYKSINK